MRVSALLSQKAPLMKPVFASAAAAIALLFTAAACDRPASPEAIGAAPPAACDAGERPGQRAEREALEAAAFAAARESVGSGSPALWTLSDEDTTLYLLGTVHLLRPGMAWMTPQIRTAIETADTVVFEADTSSPDAQRELMRFFSTHGLFPDGRQLSSLLTPEEAAALTEALESVDLPLAAIEPMRPWFAAINLSVKQMVESGFDPEAGVEKVIELAVADRDVQYAYLETVEQQLGGLAGLDDCEQVGFLLATADSLDDGIELLDMLVDEWAEGDVHGLGLLLANAEMLGSQAIYDVMLVERNALWVPQITAMLDTPGTVLIAVGAGHLAGADSVVEMLRDEGYTVEGP